MFGFHIEYVPVSFTLAGISVRLALCILGNLTNLRHLKFQRNKKLLYFPDQLVRNFPYGAQNINSSPPNDTKWHPRILIQIIACCMMAPRHYLNQCCIIISKSLWHLPEGNFTGNAQDIHPWYVGLLATRKSVCRHVFKAHMSTSVAMKQIQFVCILELVSTVESVCRRVIYLEVSWNFNTHCWLLSKRTLLIRSWKRFFFPLPVLLALLICLVAVSRSF